MCITERFRRPDLYVCDLLLSDASASHRSLLKTPTRDGEVLVAPRAGSWLVIARGNSISLRSNHACVGGVLLSDLRRRTREAVLGTDEPLTIVAGHQPEFFHPGVWAKFVAAVRFAEACGGIACHLVTDGDVPKSDRLTFPRVDDGNITLHSEKAMNARRGRAFEELEALSANEVDSLGQEVSEALQVTGHGDAWSRFAEGFRESGEDGWVGQFLDGARALDHGLGFSIQSKRLSKSWGGPFLSDLIANAPSFAGVYNQSLADYRKVRHVRTITRPMPDLYVGQDRCELPLWVYHAGEARRRVFVHGVGHDSQLFGENVVIGSLKEIADHFLNAPITEGEWGGWKFRPRALVLTIWARLMLADLFVHGIGGAKYDEISDAIISTYYGLQPPSFVCVSATLHLGLPESNMTDDELRRLERNLRDIQWNPHSALAGRFDSDLIERRALAARLVEELRERSPNDHKARRRVFDEIRSLNSALRELGSAEIELVRQKIEAAKAAVQRNRLAGGREYFYGLYGDANLARLMQGLPAVEEFRL